MENQTAPAYVFVSKNDVEHQTLFFQKIHPEFIEEKYISQMESGE